TFDYGNPQAFARIDSPEDVMQQLVAPTGLRARGAVPFVDNGKRYLDAPTHFGFGRLTSLAGRLRAWRRGELDCRRTRLRHRRYTFGAIFLEKPAAGSEDSADNRAERA